MSGKRKFAPVPYAERKRREAAEMRATLVNAAESFADLVAGRGRWQRVSLVVECGEDGVGHERDVVVTLADGTEERPPKGRARPAAKLAGSSTGKRPG